MGHDFILSPLAKEMLLLFIIYYFLRERERVSLQVGQVGEEGTGRGRERES